MVGRVLTGNGITTYGNGATSLIGRDALQQLCRQRLHAFREQPDQRLVEVQGSPMRPGPLRVLQRRQAMAIVGLRVAPPVIDSTGRDLMPHVHSVGLDLKDAIDQVSVFPVLDQLQSGLDPEPLLLRAQASLPEGDHTGVHLHGGGQANEIAHVHRDHNLIAGQGMGEDRVILGASKTNMHGRLCRNSLFTGPAGKARTEIFVNQQPQGMAIQPRWRVRGRRGRPGGLGRRAWISA